MADKLIRNVLIVDSQADWVLKLTGWLSNEFKVFIARSFIEASDYLDHQASSLDVVITEACLDETKPNIRDGLDLVSKVNELLNHTRTIIVTGYPIFSEARKIFKEKTAYDYIEKYPASDELCEIVRKAAEEAENARNHIDIFVVMPFDKKFNQIFEYIHDVADEMNKVCEKADKNLAPGTNDEILEDVLTGINNAEVVIAELGGGNPNVFFEVGISDALQKKVILISEESEKNIVPIMLSRRRIILYTKQWGSEKKLQSDLQVRLEELFSKDIKQNSTFPDVDPSSCFIISASNADGRETYETITKEGVKNLGLNGIYIWDEILLHKLDTGIGRSVLIEQILHSSSYVVADLSWDEPLAFYLAGMAYGLRKDYKFLYHKDHEPPFDIRDLGLLRHSNKTKADRDVARNVLYEWMQTVGRKNTFTRTSANYTKDETLMETLQDTNPITSILFLAAEPTNQVQLRLGQEFREIREELSRALQRDRFKVELPELSLRSRDIARALLETDASIVHFSGHGGDGGQLYFETNDGGSLPVKPSILADLFKQFSGKFECVVLNACFSKRQATAIAKHVDHVIGMRKGISDSAAIAFSIGFYQALGAGKNIEEAFEFAKIQSGLQSASEYQTPVFLKKVS